MLDRLRVEFSILGRNLEPASCQKMFDFIAEEIPERPCEHQSLLTPAFMRDGKNHLYVIDLLRAMKRGHSLADLYLPAVGGIVLSHQHLSHVHGIVHAFGIRLEHIQDQPCPRREMLADALQAVHLLMHLQQVLKWPEGNNDQPEFFAEVEPRHVPLDEVNALAGLHE